MTSAIAVSGYSAAQLKTIRTTVARDTNDTEFDLFMEACRAYKLDPFRKQIICVVFNKDKADRRQMTIIVTRDGLRIMAQRCGNYRPAIEPPIYEIEESAKCKTNPMGILSATVQLWQQDSGGEWFPVVGQAFWEEFAPVKDEWAYCQERGKRAPTGEQSLEGNWLKMPRIMIAKCAEAQALRAGWPDQFSGVYAEEEIHRMEAEASASEELQAFEIEQRKAALGGPSILMVFDDSAALQNVPMGKVHGRVEEFLRNATPEDAYKFRVRNVEALRQFWAAHPADAMDIKQRLEPLAGKFDPTGATEPA